MWDITLEIGLLKLRGKLLIFREGVRGVAGVAMATPIFRILVDKILSLKGACIQKPNCLKAQVPK